MRISILTEHAEWVKPVIAAGRLLNPLDVEVVEGLDGEADFQIIGSTIFHSLEEANDPRLKQPFGIWERADQEIVAPFNRALLLRPECRLWLRDCQIRDPALNNAPLVEDCYHFNFLPRNEDRYPANPPNTLLGEAELAKIHSLLSFPSLDPMAVWRDMMPLSSDERRIDVCFVGSVEYRHPPLREHRLTAVRAMGQLANRRVLLGIGAPLEFPAYFDAISRSKIVVAPWSMTMCSYRNWEALLAACVVITPDCWLQQTYHPDITADRRNTVACRIDFSDLKDRVDEILDNYPHYYENALAVRRTLLTCRDRAPIARDLYTLVMAALGREPSPRLEQVLDAAPASLRFMSRGLGRIVGQSSQTLTQKNLFAGSRNFADARWRGHHASASAQAAIDSVPAGLVPVKLVEDRAPAEFHQIGRTFGGSAGPAAYAVSFFACAAERRVFYARFGRDNSNARVEARFFLDRGAVDAVLGTGKGARPLQAGMAPLPGGWWWCWLSGQFDDIAGIGGSDAGEDAATEGMAVAISLADDQGSRIYQGDGCSGMWLAGPRMECGAQAVFDIREWDDDPSHEAAPEPGLGMWLEYYETSAAEALEEIVTLAPPYQPEGRYGWVAHLPSEIEPLTDHPEAPKGSPLVLIEGELELAPGHQMIQLICGIGQGAHSFWRGTLYFSTSDGSDPNTNERIYRVCRAES